MDQIAQDEQRAREVADRENASADPGTRRVLASLEAQIPPFTNKHFCSEAPVVESNTSSPSSVPELYPVYDDTTSSDSDCESDSSLTSLSSMDIDATESLLRRIEPLSDFVRRINNSDEGDFHYESDGARD